MKHIERSFDNAFVNQKMYEFLTEVFGHKPQGIIINERVPEDRVIHAKEFVRILEKENEELKKQHKTFIILHDDIENSEAVLFDAELPYEVIDGKLTHDITHREIELKHIPVEWHFVTMEDLPDIIFRMKIALYNMNK